MKKLLLISAATLIVSNSTFAGGILTNTNQHAAFLRMLSRGATTEIDGALSNPAGLAFLPKDGFHVGLSIQSAYQTRNIDASFMTYNALTPQVLLLQTSLLKNITKEQPPHRLSPASSPHIKKVSGQFQDSSPSLPEVERRLLMTDCLCSTPQLWQVFFKKV